MTRKKITDENILFKKIPTILIAEKASNKMLNRVTGYSYPSFLMILFVISAIEILLLLSDWEYILNLFFSKMLTDIAYLSNSKFEY